MKHGKHRVDKCRKCQDGWKAVVLRLKGCGFQDIETPTKLVDVMLDLRERYEEAKEHKQALSDSRLAVIKERDKLLLERAKLLEQRDRSLATLDWLQRRYEG
jgi:hypothetical protein